MSTSKLVSLLSRQYEVRWGRLFVRSVFAGFGVVAYCLGLSYALFSDAHGVVLMAGQGVGLLVGGGLLWAGFPVSRRMFDDVTVSSDDLAQIERDEGWFDKGLAELFYANSGSRLPKEFSDEVMAELVAAGHDFAEVARAVCNPGRDIEYSLRDVVLLVQGSSKLSAVGMVDTDLGPQITNRAMAFIAGTVMLAALPVCFGLVLIAANALIP